MAHTTSLAWPNMLDPATNQVAVLEDNVSIVNRTRLLLLTEPTSLYYSPDFGIGLIRHLWHYNNENQKAIMQNRIVEGLRVNEPYVIPDETQFSDGLLFTGSQNQQIEQDYNQLKFTMAVKTVYDDTVTVSLNNE